MSLQSYYFEEVESPVKEGGTFITGGGVGGGINNNEKIRKINPNIPHSSDINNYYSKLNGMINVRDFGCNLL